MSDEPVEDDKNPEGVLSENKEVSGLLRVLAELKGKACSIRVGQHEYSGTVILVDPRFCVVVLKNQKHAHAIKVSKMSMVTWINEP